MNARQVVPGAGRPMPETCQATAFTLLEVMIALAIFFMAVFTILDSTSQSLRAARLLQQKEAMPDARFLLADLWPTNKLEEGILEGDFGDLYPDFIWTRETTLIGTNGLFRVDFTIQGVVGRRPLESKVSVQLWAPDSQVSTFRRQL
ncbi:MAG TPA: prepilin-type N-terminal cleavage/methylation domain-containing protein [Verrucomicrobiae bacterium]|nr:prepilin-type N-terminal cleavage/methylation domain-containing protein [Verrucomicrobiae bacterium]